MPAKSAKQWGLMQAAAHGNPRGLGPSEAVAKEFIHKTPASKRKAFAKSLMAKRKRADSK
jgi:hypothetical protein